MQSLDQALVHEAVATGRNECRGSIVLSCGEGMSHRAVHIAVLLEEPARASLEPLTLAGIEQLEAATKCLAEELVIAVPPSLVVERDEEEVARTFDLQQPLPG